MNKLCVVEQDNECGVVCLQVPSGRVASGEKIGVISFGSQQQQQYRSVYNQIAMLLLLLGHITQMPLPKQKQS